MYYIHCRAVPELESAFSLNESEWEKKYNFKKIGKEDNIIFYCRSGRRSETACEIARSKGLSAKNYLGSYLEWAHKE